MWVNFLCCILIWWNSASYGCEKLTTHRRMQRAALSSPKRPCSNPPETQTCFVRSTVFASIFGSTHLISFIQRYSRWLVLLRYTFEGKPSAWTDPNLQPGRFTLSKGKQTSECRISRGVSCSSARLDVWMHYCCVMLRLWIYGSMSW